MKNSPLIGIMNVGVGNVGSVSAWLEKLCIPYTYINSDEGFERIDGLIIPGVGSFGGLIDGITKANLSNKIRNSVLEKKLPILGICAGYQIFFESSEESPSHTGLSLLPGKVIQISSIYPNTISPNVGWASLIHTHNEYLWWKSDFYFDHNYFVKTIKDYSTGEISLANEAITVFTKFNNIWGCQFHPEKSSTNGLRFLRSFTNSLLR